MVLIAFVVVVCIVVWRCFMPNRCMYR
jgi:hypothetical protein